MEDMAEDTVGKDTEEEDIVEEDTKEETMEDIKEDLIRRNTMFAIGQVVGQPNTLLRNTKRYMRSFINILYIP
jgi:hypothetical protein